jgi:hypothetical protein
MITALVTACAGKSEPRPPQFGAPASFEIDKATLRESRSPESLIEKLDASAYRYFRMLGPQFASRTCHELEDVRWHLPMIAIHGDAHITQFVVTRETAGLEDFDQAGFGPAVVDLVRYAASIHLACREVSWSCNSDVVIDLFFASYREALERPLEAPTPAIVARLRGQPLPERAQWLGWVDSLMQPIDGPIDVSNAWREFAGFQGDVHPARASAFFEVVRSGTLQLGVGSFLERKLLFRVRGESDDPSDDVVFEARSVLPPTGLECSWRPPHGGALHALMFMALLGRRMPEVFGFAELDRSAGAPEFWVQSWDSGYRELVLSDLADQRDLEELATDAARQLAGHFWTKFPEQLRAQQRWSQLRAFDLTDARAKRLSRDLATEAIAAWERFRAQP